MEKQDKKSRPSQKAHSATQSSMFARLVPNLAGCDVRCGHKLMIASANTRPPQGHLYRAVLLNEQRFDAPHHRGGAPRIDPDLVVDGWQEFAEEAEMVRCAAAAAVCSCTRFPTADFD